MGAGAEVVGSGARVLFQRMKMSMFPSQGIEAVCWQWEAPGVSFCKTSMPSNLCSTYNLVLHCCFCRSIGFYVCTPLEKVLRSTRCYAI